MTAKTIRQLHRWIGLLFSVSILMSAGSGVLHNVMTRTQPPPPPARPSGGGLVPEKIKVSAAEAIAKLPGGTTAQAVNLRGIGGEPWYQIYAAPPAAAIYVSAVDGRIDPAQDERYAAEIAAAFLGGAAVHKTEFLTAFNTEYLNIFRVLPVYRFDTDDPRHTRIYVSTTTGSVTRHTDDGRQFEANVFTNFHKLGFIRNKDVRDLTLTVLTAGIFLTAVLGVILFFATGRRRN